MSQIASGLRQKIARHPDASQNVIVRVNGDMDELQNALEANGFQIRRKLGLIKGFAATAPGSSIQKVADQPWVMSIEEDQQIHTM